MKALKVSENRRFLVTGDGEPFFWLGDTAWELFHKLNREEADLYLENRQKCGFNVVQAVALGEDDGIRVPNAYGRKPLKMNDAGDYDATQPDAEGEYSYWDHVDYIVDKASSLGIYVAFLPTWGDKYVATGWGKGPFVFDGESAQCYGEWLGARYKDRENIIWVLGGDRHLATRFQFEVVCGMAEGLRAGDGGRHLMTLHPCGDASSSAQVHEEPWLDFNMIQSGHGTPTHNNPNYKKLEHDINLTPTKPTLDAEPRYEDHPIGFNASNGYFDDYDVRVAAYWAVFAGGFGHTYGHHSIWIMCTDPADYFVMTWRDAIERPGAAQMQHLKKLVLARPFLERIPDQELLAANYPGANHLQATRGESYAFIYSPNGLKVQVNLGKLTGEKVVARWYCPRTGANQSIGEFANEGIRDFMPPTHGRNNDWVLVLDDASIGYSMP